MKDTIVVDNVEYVRKDSIPIPVATLPFKIIRGQNSGVFAGYLESRRGREVTLTGARRIWYWDMNVSYDDASMFLAELAETGVVSKSSHRKALPQVRRVVVLDAIEILDVSDAAKKSIEGGLITKGK
jgi:hypothetical protein